MQNKNWLFSAIVRRLPHLILIPILALAFTSVTEPARAAMQDEILSEIKQLQKTKKRKKKKKKAKDSEASEIERATDPKAEKQNDEKLPQAPALAPVDADTVASTEKRAKLKPVPTVGSAKLSAPKQLKTIRSLDKSTVELSAPSDTPLIFDIPVTYNSRVRHWIRYFQTTGRGSFRGWLERSARFIPLIQKELAKAGLPRDLVYVPMIESGFTTGAVSPANAVGMWQFIEPTGKRYGLSTSPWLDERRDVYKSTKAAIAYFKDLHKKFGSWYLVAAGYNMGENGVARLMKRYNTGNFWTLADVGALSEETQNYVPKIIAAMLIAKAPALYGFRDLNYHVPHRYDDFYAPGGTDLHSLARFLGVNEKYLKELNPELVKGYIPRDVVGHRIRVPKGSIVMVSQYARQLAGN